MSLEAPKYAGFWVRLLAELVDSTLLTLVSWGPTLLVELLLRGIRPINSFELQFVEVGFYLVLSFPYYVWGHFRFGTTLGKKWLRIRVVDLETMGPISLNQSILRYIGYGFSYAIFCLGYFMAWIHPENRALHDFMAKTVSIRT